MENLVNKKFWENKKVLVTGHTGFKGSWLSYILSDLKSKVHGLSLRNKNYESFYHKLNVGKCIISEKFLDINNLILCKKYIKKINPQIAFHFAAQPLVIDSYENPLYTLNTNILGTANILEALRNVKSLKCVIIVTSDKCYLNIDKKLKFFNESDPLGGYDPYSGSKAAAELISTIYQKSFFFKNKVNLATVRAGNVLGGGDFADNRIFVDIIKSLNTKKKLLLRNPKSIRPWQHIIDLLRGYIILCQNLYSNKSYIGAWNFGPNKSNIKNVLQLLSETEKSLGKINFSIKRSNLKESKLLGLSIKKSKEKLKWRPIINFSKTIKLTSEWYLSKNKKDITQKQIKEFL